jgi:hypothetical protein
LMKFGLSQRAIGKIARLPLDAWTLDHCRCAWHAEMF